jgi:inosine-uridine nucleoside N-ribohydrolase
MRLKPVPRIIVPLRLSRSPYNGFLPPHYSKALLVLAGAVLSITAAAAAQARLIFDTDIGNDIDDALALAMIHSMETRGETKLLAVTVTKDNRYAGPFIDLIDTFYGRPDIPIGTVRNGKTPDVGKYLRSVVESGFYPHHLDDSQKYPDAVAVLRKTLAAEKDRSVTIVQVGFSTNLARLLDSAPDQNSMETGRELVRKKVRLICVMAGAFPAGPPEYNVKIDIPSARKVFADAPVPVVFSGYEIGKQILYPAASIEKDFAYVPHHPVADGYRAYMKMPYDRPTWDLTAVLYAVRPGKSFGLSEAGVVRVDEDGTTRFRAAASGSRKYLTMTPEQGRLALAAMIELASQAPGGKARK